MILQAKFWISCSFFILVEEVFDHTVEQSYIKDSSASQKRACSDILSRPFLSKETSDVNTACSSSMAAVAKSM